MAIDKFSAAAGLAGPAAAKVALSPSAAVVAAKERRAARSDVSVQWFDKQVIQSMGLTMRQRTRVATEFIKSRVVQNISKAVGKTTSGGKVRVTERSKPGEYPRAETTQLMKTIFGEVREVKKGTFDGFVGTPLNYGLILELRLDRSFLKRTLNENLVTVRKILTARVR